MWLYRLTNNTTGKQYIGTSVNPVQQRISRHVYAAKTGRDDMPIADAIKKYGIAQFNIETIGSSNDYDWLLMMEALAIKHYGTRIPNGYNLTAGGRGTRRPCSQETKAKMSEKLKGKKPWNYGIGPTSRITHPHRTTGKGGPEKGTRPWNFGKTFGRMPDAHRKAIADAVRQVRATRFWSTRKSNQV